MNALLADLHVDHGDNKNDTEQDQRGGTGAALIIGSQRVVDKSDHR